MSTITRNAGPFARTMLLGLVVAIAIAAAGAPAQAWLGFVLAAFSSPAHGRCAMPARSAA